MLGILDELVRERGMGLIFISHDLKLVSQLLRPRAGHVCRPGGRGAAGGASSRDARHPYTRGLLACLPHIGGDRGAAAGAAPRRELERPLAEVSA